MSLDQNVHFQGLRYKTNVEFTSVNDHLFYEHNLPTGRQAKKMDIMDRL